ncbi:MAG: hypothetical protein KDK36_08115 [Leptospiraceae bacterium]|nr:hypothetical protein [Leptospiraceae bacterium]
METKIKTHLSAVLIFFISILITFFPIFSGDLDFISHDNLAIFYPAFLNQSQFWDPMVGMGYPSYAEPQNFAFSWVLYLFPKTAVGFNIISLLSVFLSCYFSFLLCYNFSKDFFGSIVGGFIFGFSGSIIGQITMMPVSLSSAFLPLTLYSFYNLGKNPNSIKFHILPIASIYFSLSLGWPLIILYYPILIGLLYIFIFFPDKKSRFVILWKFLFVSFSGILLAAPTILTLIEILPFTPRSEKIDIHSFNAYKMNLSMLSRLFFPFIFGGIEPNEFIKFEFIRPYTGVENFHETNRYFGLLPFFLAIFGFNYIQEKRIKYFITFSCVFYLLYSFGTSNFLGKIIFNTPIINRLRGPARHFLEINLFFSILSSLGIAYLKNIEHKKLFKLAVFFIPLIIVVLLISLINLHPILKNLYSAKDFQSFFGNNLILTQIAILLSSSVFLFLISKNKKLILVLPLIIFIDLAINQSFLDWKIQDHSLKNKKESFNIETKGYTDFYYPMSFKGKYYYSSPSFENIEFRNNFNSIHNIPSAGYNGPLELEDVVTTGYLRLKHKEFNELFSVEYLGGVYKGNYFSGYDKSVFVGNDTNLIDTYFPLEEIREFYLPITEGEINRFSIYSSIFYFNSPLPSSKIKIGKIEILDSSGSKTIERKIFYPDDIQLENSKCAQARKHKNYFLEIKSLKNCISIYKLNVTWENKFRPNSIKVKINNGTIAKLFSFSYEKNEKEIFLYAYPLLKKGYPVESIDDKVITYKSEIYPKVYSVRSVFIETKENILKNLIQFSQEKKGINPFKRTFVESGNNLESDLKNLDKESNEKNIKEIILSSEKEDYLSFETDFKEDQFVVINHSYYPAWNSYINGKKVNLYRVNNSVQGVFLPKGKNKVEVILEPKKASIGKLTSLVSLVLLIIIFFLKRRSQLKEIDTGLKG